MSITAKSQGLVRCPVCHQLNRVASTQVMACGRCGSAVRQRSAPRLQVVWALLITAMICYIPANLLPVMSVVSVGKTQANTLLQGVVHFMQSGAYLLGLVVLIASILVPLFKMLTLLGLLLSMQFGWCEYLVEKTRLYRFAALIGPWSMVDVFVIALMVSMIQFGEVASILVGDGTLAFAAVVLLTILATELLDIRWLWDRCKGDEVSNDK